MATFKFDISVVAAMGLRILTVRKDSNQEWLGSRRNHGADIPLCVPLCSGISES
jgi:hypothetical protein